MVNAIQGAENGGSYWLESQHYWKAKSYIVDNMDPERQKQFTIGASCSHRLTITLLIKQMEKDSPALVSMSRLSRGWLM